MKSVKFYKTVSVILIPCRSEYYESKLSKDIWWDSNDLDRFRVECLFELTTVVNLSRTIFEKELKDKKKEINNKNFMKLAQNKVYQSVY